MKADKFQEPKNQRTKGGRLSGRMAFGIFALVLWFFGSSVLMPPSFAADNERLLRHIVMYKFKEGLPPAQIQEVVNAFAGLPKKISTIVGFEHGTNVSPEGKSEGFTHVFVVTF